MTDRKIKIVETQLDKANFFSFDVSDISVVDTEYEANFSELDQVSHDLIDLASKGEPSALNTAFDQRVAPVVHSTFMHLPKSFVANPRFWQWLSVVEYRQLAEIRAGGPAAEDKAQYFLSGLTLGAQMSHVFQKAFLIADAVETVFSGDAAYSDTIKIMGSAQNVQSIGEGKISFSKEFLRSKLPEIHTLTNDIARKNFIKKLNAEAENLLQEYTVL